jgi:hypothetical protein
LGEGFLQSVPKGQAGEVPKPAISIKQFRGPWLVVRLNSCSFDFAQDKFCRNDILTYYFSVFSACTPVLSCPPPRLAPALSAKAETGAGAGESKNGGNAGTGVLSVATFTREILIDPSTSSAYCGLSSGQRLCNPWLKISYLPQTNTNVNLQKVLIFTHFW